MKNHTFKKMVTILALGSMLSLVGCGGSTADSSNADTTEETTSVEVTTTVAEEDVTTTTVADTTTEATSADTTTEAVTTTAQAVAKVVSNQELDDAEKQVCELLQSSFTTAGSSCYATYDDISNTYTVYMYFNQDLMGDINNIKNGTADASSWDTVINSFCQSCNSLCDSVNLMSPDSNVEIAIINEQTLDEIVLDIVNGEVVYDIVNSDTEPTKVSIDKSLFSTPSVNTNSIDTTDTVSYISSLLTYYFDSDDSTTADVSYDEDTNTYTLLLTVDGLSDSAKLMYDGQADTSAWDNFVNTTLTSCNSYQQLAQQIDDTATVRIIVLDDTDPDFELLEVYNNQVVYDVMKD